MPITDASAGASREFIVLRLDAMDFAIDIMAVREIRGWTPATALPHAPSFVRGVINLRGAVLPIIDLAERLGFAPIELTARRVVIVVQIGGRLVGLLVDAVSDILSQPLETIQPIPDVASEAVKLYVQGVFAFDDRMIGLIRLDHLAPPALGEAA
ncbi:purine-binding chemotaxis protein CheW [Rhodoblastus acidophilus]|uniref:chemotaxis protein CheW n=1 Tax=Rhodoblastus acidophilus TaxID=1074 RepID=UPI00161513AB|nr:chemotaxis protein CheW [Rhodoblastus acidophilus]MCW2283281.1 purine-binding chemotaxis protein CheW [Rhodoblastus acidophilus]MCW2332141.1 purine-binding chemotaxis protein CheW [Rhodoblastus acidophilus]